MLKLFSVLSGSRPVIVNKSTYFAKNGRGGECILFCERESRITHSLSRPDAVHKPIKINAAAAAVTIRFPRIVGSGGGAGTIVR